MKWHDANALTIRRVERVDVRGDRNWMERHGRGSDGERKELPLKFRRRGLRPA
jgi:hypothetical protein